MRDDDARMVGLVDDGLRSLTTSVEGHVTPPAPARIVATSRRRRRVRGVAAVAGVVGIALGVSTIVTDFSTAPSPGPATSWPVELDVLPKPEITPDPYALTEIPDGAWLTSADLEPVLSGQWESYDSDAYDFSHCVELMLRPVDGVAHRWLSNGGAIVAQHIFLDPQADVVADSSQLLGRLEDCSADYARPLTSLDGTDGSDTSTVVYELVEEGDRFMVQVSVAYNVVLVTTYSGLADLNDPATLVAAVLQVDRPVSVVMDTYLAACRAGGDCQGGQP